MTKKASMMTLLSLLLVCTVSLPLFAQGNKQHTSDEPTPVRQLDLPRHLQEIGLKGGEVSSLPMQDVQVGMVIGRAGSGMKEKRFASTFRGNIQSLRGEVENPKKLSRRLTEGNIQVQTTGGFNDPKLHPGQRLGVAPGAQLYLYQGAHSNQSRGTGPDSLNMGQVLRALDQFKAKQMDVVHLGFTGESIGQELLLRDAISSLHMDETVVVTGAGDETEYVDGYFWERDSVPAVYDETLTVSSLSRKPDHTEELRLSRLSNYGASIDVTAPGWNAIVGNQIGTKQAAAHVTGAAAVLKAVGKKKGQELSPQQIKSTLKVTGSRPADGQKYWDGERDEHTEPLIHVQRAIDYVSRTASQHQEDYTVLVVPGFAGNQMNSIGVPYMNQNVEALRSMNFRARRLNISTVTGVETTAKRIRKQVLKEAQNDRKVILFVHSKGGADSTTALARYPELKKHVAGLVALQPAFRGSPVADAIMSNDVTSGASKLVFETLFGGEEEVVSQLTHQYRNRFLQKYSYPADDVPTVVLRTSFDRTYPDTILWGNENVIDSVLGASNDGMMTLSDQTIPGADSTITLENVAHLETTVREHPSYTPSYVTARTMLELFQQIEEK